MRRDSFLVALLLAALFLIAGCGGTHARVAGADPKVSTDVSQRIDAVEDAEVTVATASTPAEKVQAKAEVKAKTRAIARQETAEERATLFRDGLGALFVVCVALAIRKEFPLLALPMNVIAGGVGSFAAIAFALRTLLPFVPYVVVAGAIVAAVYHWRHSKALHLLATDVAQDVAHATVKLRGTGRRIVDGLRAHIAHTAPPAAPTAPPVAPPAAVVKAA